MRPLWAKKENAINELISCDSPVRLYRSPRSKRIKWPVWFNCPDLPTTLQEEITFRIDKGVCIAEFIVEDDIDHEIFAYKVENFVVIKTFQEISELS